MEGVRNLRNRLVDHTGRGKGSRWVSRYEFEFAFELPLLYSGESAGEMGVGVDLVG